MARRDHSHFSPDFSFRLDALHFALVYEGKIYYFNNDPHSKNHILIPELSQDPLGLSEALSLEDYLRESELFEHVTISQDRFGLVESMAESGFISSDAGGYSVSNIVAFLYEELFPFLCGKDADRQFTERASLARIVAERKDAFAQSLATYTEKFKAAQLEQEPFVQQIKASLKTLVDELIKKRSLEKKSLASLSDVLSSVTSGAYLVWDNHVYPAVLAKDAESCSRPSRLVSSKESHIVLGTEKSAVDIKLLIDWNHERSMNLEDEFHSVSSDAYTAYLASSVPEEMIAQLYNRTKYTSLLNLGRVDHDIFGFEVIKSDSRGGIPAVFVYMKIPPIFVQDPRVWLDIYYPYPAKELGLELAYHKGEIKILENLVRGPTKHYAIAAGEHRFGSMCGFRERGRKLFDLPVTWIASNLMMVVEMFTNGLTVENLLAHNAELMNPKFNGYDRMPPQVSYSEVLKQQGFIVNKHEWPINKWPSGINREQYLERFR
jgi:hypothetical protein